MASEKTRADSIRLYHSGAASNGGAQASADACLGNYRAATEITQLSVTITSAIANITVAFVAGENGTGAGSLTCTGVDDLTWTPPGGSVGAAVTIANGETKIVEGSDRSKYVRVTRTSATNLVPGTATLTLAEQLNNAIGFDNVSSAEAAAGDAEYRAIYVRNDSANSVESIKAYIATLGTQRTSSGAQLGASGAGTITASGSLSDWPDQGWCRIADSGGTLREIVYYSSRTNTVLTVPANGRGRLGTSAGAGASSDTIDAVPGIRIAPEAPSNSLTGNIQTIANEGTSPTGRTWDSDITAATGVSIGTLLTLENYGLWIHRDVIAGAVSDPLARNRIRLSFDAP